MNMSIIAWIGGAIATAFVALWIVARRNTYKPMVKHVNLQIPRPVLSSPLKILHLTDLHMEKLSISPQALLAQIGDTNIDLIALTGDYLDTPRMTNRFLEYMDVLASLNPRYGMYAVFGNHDYCIEKLLPQLKKEMEKRGCTVLQNEHRTLELEDGVRLNIIGVDDHYTGRSDLARAYQNVPDGINLVLTHDPNIVLEMADYSFDYLLSGHFHGGQIHWPKPYHLKKMGQLPHLRIFRGLHFYQNRAYYISEGLGQTALNLRLRSRPEITFHTLNTPTVDAS